MIASHSPPASISEIELTTQETSPSLIFIEPSKAHSKKLKVLKGFVLLNEGISRTNFYSSWVFILYLGFISITYSTLEPEFLIQQLKVSAEGMGKTTAWICLVDYSVRLVCALFYGPMIDQYGRKALLTVGIVLTSIGYFLIPVLSHSLFPGYYISKSFISGGLIALQMLPFSADYIDDSTKGLMTGLNYGLAFVGGGIGALMMKVLLSFGYQYKTIYWVISVVILLAGFLIRNGIKGGNTYYKNLKNEPEQETLTQANKWQEVKHALKTIPWLTYSIIFGVLGNADFYILTTGLVIWMKALMPDGGDPTPIAASYQAIFFILSFFLTAIVALKVDKMPHMRLILPTLIVATLGFGIVPFVKSATSPLLYIFFVIEGLSLPGIFVFSSYLSIRYNPPEIRGTLSGIGNGIGFLGAIIILGVGGFLHDYWRKDASFLLYGILMAVTLFAICVVHQVMSKQGKLSKDAGLKAIWKADVEKIE